MTGAGSFWFANPSSGFYNGVATQSLRFDDGSSAYLSRTPSSAGNRRTFTWSSWVKRGNLGSDQTLLMAGTDVLNQFRLVSEFSDAKFKVYYYVSGNKYVTPSAVFRDVSAWYHVVFAIDTTQSTASNRIKIYINGEQITDLETENQPTQNFETQINNNTLHAIGRRSYASDQYFDGYLSEVNFVDGLALDPTYFGETKNGVWIAKEYTGSYGTNGFRLQFNQTGTGTASASTIGADTSGNNNHFTSSGIVASDCAMPDSPENNFCTYNPLDAKGNDNTFSEGNLKVVVAAQNTDEQTTATFAVSSGKWYWEHRLISTTTSNAGYFKIGLRDVTLANAWTVRGSDGETQDAAGTTATASVSYTTGNVVGVYLDMDNAKWYVSVDGTLQNSANLTNGTGFLHSNLSGTIYPFILNASSGGTHTGMGNFGQDSTFAGLETAGGYSDANGNGDFHSAVTSPYLALCSANLPEPTIGPNSDTQSSDHFNTVLYTGNGYPTAGTQSITGVGHRPDWVWIKARNSVTRHSLTDSSRGVGKTLSSNLTDAESTQSDSITAFGADGFTVGDNSESGSNVNVQNNTYVAWNWKANGGTTSSNTDGSITSTVQANTTAGFSIVTYTGNDASSATVGHGLSQAPEWVIVKNRQEAISNPAWAIYHASNTSAPATDYLSLDSANATADANTLWNDTAPTSTVVSLGTADSVLSGSNHIMYCFHSVEGYSKFGSFSGNSSADGTFVYTGFRPAWVMIKNTNATSAGASWFIYDNKRDLVNVMGNELGANSSGAEGSVDGNALMDFYSNGFKPRSNSYTNQATQIYMAFAEAPFKYANAR